MKKKKELSAKIKMFCEEYLVDLNATQSAIRAGYSKKTAKQQGSKLLTKVDVQDYIALLKIKRIKRIQVSQDYVLEKLVEIVELNAQKQADFIPVDLGNVNPETGKPVTDIKIIEKHINSDMVHKAVKTIGEHLEMFKNVNKDAPADDRPPEEIAVNFADQIIKDHGEDNG